MNFISATKYMEHGYRVRRTDWDSDTWLSCYGLYFEKQSYYYVTTYCNVRESYVKEKVSTLESFVALESKDILADDWELITDNIRKHFNKHGVLEYNDEPDWDNFEMKEW